jgi:sigma-70-like protein
MRHKWSLRFIRQSIRNQRISFPSQVPVFQHLHRPDIQWRIVSLYFVQGWSSGKIAGRYGISRERVAQLLRQWTSRAILRGYVDRIPGEKECATYPG